MTKTIWSYWEGPQPPYIEICLRSIKEICNRSQDKWEFLLVTPSNLQEYIPVGALHPAYAEIPNPGPKASAIRAALLAVYGGWWWDADTVALGDPSNFLSSLGLPEYPEIAYTTWPIYPNRALNGYVYALGQSKSSLAWLDAVNSLLSTDFDRATRWLELGEKSLTPVVLSSPFCRRFDRRTVLPISIDDHVEAFFQARDYREFIIPQTLCFGLNHSWFMLHHEHDMLMKPCHWKNSPILIHQLLADALELITGER